jgi:hypothetical protein
MEFGNQGLYNCSFIKCENQKEKKSRENCKEKETRNINAISRELSNENKIL